MPSDLSNQLAHFHLFYQRKKDKYFISKIKVDSQKNQTYSWLYANYGPQLKYYSQQNNRTNSLC